MNIDDEFESLFDLPMFEDVKPPTPRITANDRLFQSFVEINNFYEANNREPSIEGTFEEKKLARTLNSIRKNKADIASLRSSDKFGLLNEQSILDIDKEFEEIMNNPDFEFTDEDLSIFDVPEYLTPKKEKTEADFVAQRTKCKDFYLYEDLFKTVHKELKTNKRTLVRFSNQALKEGCFYVVSGVLVYLEKIFELKINRNYHYDGRTRCIYENGTESNILLDTLRKSVYMDGYLISESSETNEEAFQNSFSVAKEDVQDGWIYVLRSLSNESAIRNQKDLYKIGFSTIPVEDRIKNAEQEPTYLMDRVEIVASWKTYNMKTHEFENILHKFFKTAAFHIKVQDKNGMVYTPREWFVVPLSIIELVINKIIDKSIINFEYNRELEALVEIPKKEEHKKSSKVDTTGWSILTLNIKQVWFNMILSGEKTIEYRDLKESKINTYTWVDNNDGKRYLRNFNAIKFYVGYNKNNDYALVEVTNITYNAGNRQVEYHLGKILEIDANIAAKDSI